MTFRVDHSNPAMISLSGSVLGGPEAMEFTESVSGCIGKGIVNAVIDLSEVELMNSSGLGMLVAAFRTLTSAGGGLALVGPNERIQRLFTTTRLDSVFRQFESREEAVASFTHQ
ncbi:MAG: STAS domain-containing protein [Chlorobi bacterium]|nr:STAS domain-containing protein [Chlorobiota bacterium]